MNCPQCKTEMIKAQATDFGEFYDYCRPCKKELQEMPQASVKNGLFGIVSASDAWSGHKEPAPLQVQIPGIIKFNLYQSIYNSSGPCYSTQQGSTHVFKPSVIDVCLRQTRCNCGAVLS